eukprot:snap_masked-scaffold_21-processed-gene-5.81-mRNA-1 protein AED:1.00 eAED:1.00 QI:0/0/0/0/1/1/2/0/67
MWSRASKIVLNIISINFSQIRSFVLPKSVCSRFIGLLTSKFICMFIPLPGKDIKLVPAREQVQPVEF